jgi:hypothetical protein
MLAMLAGQYGEWPQTLSANPKRDKASSKMLAMLVRAREHITLSSSSSFLRTDMFARA